MTGSRGSAARPIGGGRSVPSERRPLPTFPSSVPEALADNQLRNNLRHATRAIRAKRSQVVEEVPDWLELTRAARAIKEEALGGLHQYLQELEDAVIRAGGKVHWARTAAEANEIVTELVVAAGASEVVKVKSITTDEVGLNEALANAGVSAVETDLAELIIQMASEESSHFLVPAIHKNRTQIRDLFRDHLGLPGLTDEPEALAEAARLHLREKFLKAEVAISGANFAAADTGTVGVVESEGNGRMCLTLPRVLITLMGIEKVLPAFRDLEVFLQLLPRSATGERMNPYTSLWTGTHPGTGPRSFISSFWTTAEQGSSRTPWGDRPFTVSDAVPASISARSTVGWGATRITRPTRVPSDPSLPRNSWGRGCTTLCLLHPPFVVPAGRFVRCGSISPGSFCT